MVPDNHRQALVARANQLWHTDSTFKKTPALASVLSARTVPKLGGETEFVSMRLAWERLPSGGRRNCATSSYATATQIRATRSIRNS